MGNKWSKRTTVVLRPKICKPKPPPEPEPDPCEPVIVPCCRNEISGCLKVVYGVPTPIPARVWTAKAIWNETEKWWETDHPLGPGDEPWDAYLRCNVSGYGSEWQVRIHDDCGWDTGWTGLTTITTCLPFFAGHHETPEVACVEPHWAGTFPVRLFSWVVWEE